MRYYWLISPIIQPSIGVDFFSKTIRYKDKSLKFQVWDSAGQEKYRSLIPNYIRGSSIVFDIWHNKCENIFIIIIGADTFESLDSWINFINDNEKTSIVLLGNKNDLCDIRYIYHLLYS